MTPVDDTRTRLLDTAGAIFAEKGFRAATVREISEAAGVNLAAINYHFGDKEQLYIECVRHAGSSCAQLTPPPQWATATPPEQKVRDFVRMFLQRAVVEREPAWHAELITRELSRPSKACAAFAQEFVRPNVEMLHAILGELLGTSVSPQKMQLVSFSIVGQCLHYRYCREVMRHILGAGEFEKLHIDVLTDHITEFSLAAIQRLRQGKARDA